MKKTVVLILALCASATLCARPGHGFGPRPVGRPMMPVPTPHHHHHHHGNGGAIAAGIVGGALLGGVVASTVAPAPVVVAPAPVVVQPAPVVVQQPVYQPVYQTQNVWVEGRYVNTVQPNGAVIRTWQPGHYEQRTAQVQ